MSVRYQSVKLLKQFYKKLLKRKNSFQYETIKYKALAADQKLRSLQVSINDIIDPQKSPYIQQLFNRIQYHKKEMQIMDFSVTTPLNIAIMGSNSNVKSDLIDLLLDGRVPELSRVIESNRLCTFKYGNEEKVIVEGPYENFEMLESALETFLENYELEQTLRFNVLEEEYNVLKDKYYFDPAKVNSLENEFVEKSNLISSEIINITYQINHERLRTFNFIKVNNIDCEEDFVYFDGILNLIDQHEVYMEVLPEILDRISLKRSVGVIFAESINDDELDNIMHEANKRYHPLVSVVPLKNSNEFIKDIFELFELHFVNQKKSIKLKTQLHVLNSLLEVYKLEMKEVTEALIKGFNKRAEYKSQFISAIDKESNNIKTKVDWLFQNYEMRTKINIESKSKDAFLSGQESNKIEILIKDEILGIKSFQRELNNLKETLNKRIEKFYMNHTNDYFLDSKANVDVSQYDLEDKAGFLDGFDARTYELINDTDLEKILLPLQKKNTFGLSFGKKKKIESLQESLIGILDSAVNKMKKKFNEEVEQSITTINLKLYDKIDHTFETVYFEATEVNQIVRLIDNTSKTINLAEASMTIKNIIRNK